MKCILAILQFQALRLPNTVIHASLALPSFASSFLPCFYSSPPPHASWLHSSRTFLSPPHHCLSPSHTLTRTLWSLIPSLSLPLLLYSLGHCSVSYHTVIFSPPTFVLLATAPVSFFCPLPCPLVPAQYLKSDKHAQENDTSLWAKVLTIKHVALDVSLAYLWFCNRELKMHFALA